MWSTMAGSFCTSREAETTLKMSELNVMADTFAPFHITIKTSNYNVIFGRDLLWKLGIQVDFQTNINLPMKPIDCKMRTHFTIKDSKNVRDATKRIKKILDANYKKANLKEIVNNLKYLNNDKQSLIQKLLRKHEEMFDSTLACYIGSESKIELLEGAKPYHVKPFPISSNTRRNS